MTIRPIKTKAAYRAALEEIERLMDAEPGTAVADRLEVLATLVEDYENNHSPMASPDPVESLKYYIESRGITRNELARYLGSLRAVEDILARRKALTIEMIRRLHSGLGISADLLIDRYPLLKSAA